MTRPDGTSTGTSEQPGGLGRARQALSSAVGAVRGALAKKSKASASGSTSRGARIVSVRRPAASSVAPRTGQAVPPPPPPPPPPPSRMAEARAATATAETITDADWVGKTGADVPPSVLRVAFEQIGAQVGHTDYGLDANDLVISTAVGDSVCAAADWEDLHRNGAYSHIKWGIAHRLAQRVVSQAYGKGTRILSDTFAALKQALHDGVPLDLAVQRLKDGAYGPLTEDEGGVDLTDEALDEDAPGFAQTYERVEAVAKEAGVDVDDNNNIQALRRIASGLADDPALTDERILEALRSQSLIRPLGGQRGGTTDETALPKPDLAVKLDDDGGIVTTIIHEMDREGLRACKVRFTHQVGEGESRTTNDLDIGTGSYRWGDPAPGRHTFAVQLVRGNEVSPLSELQTIEVPVPASDAEQTEDEWEGQPARAYEETGVAGIVGTVAFQAGYPVENPAVSKAIRALAQELHSGGLVLKRADILQRLKGKVGSPPPPPADQATDDPGSEE